ncbi:MAG: hypothetical protein WC641_03450 [Patescibacteria group bacterium]
MDVFNHYEFAKIKAKAESLYKSVVKVHCPALGMDVHFSSDGFHHLQYDGTRAERTKLVQRNKILCLQEAVDIIKKTTTIQEYRSAIQPFGKADKNGFRQTKHVKYYAFHAITDLTKPRRVNVVVRRIGDGNHHFWSVMPSWKEDKINDSQTVRKIGGGWMLDS